MIFTVCRKDENKEKEAAKVQLKKRLLLNRLLPVLAFYCDDPNLNPVEV